MLWWEGKRQQLLQMNCSECVMVAWVTYIVKTRCAGGGGYLEEPQTGEEVRSTHKSAKTCPENISEVEVKTMCLNAKSIVNKKNKLNNMVEDIGCYVIGITESCANKDISDANLD